MPVMKKCIDAASPLSLEAKDKDAERPEMHQRVPLSFERMVDLWVLQDGMRYVSLLVPRGFLQEEDRENAEAVAAADREWRLTYVADLGFEGMEWVPVVIDNAKESVPDWILGGWPGWMVYRPEGADVTRFRDVARAIAEGAPHVYPHHAEGIPKLAAVIDDVLRESEIILLRCGNDVAVLDGTHRMVSYTRNVLAGVPVIDELPRVYACTLPEERRDAFTRFCVGLPKAEGRYSQRHSSQ